jgi:hypothetical protein
VNRFFSLLTFRTEGGRLRKKRDATLIRSANKCNLLRSNRLASLWRNKLMHDYWKYVNISSLRHSFSYQACFWNGNIFKRSVRTIMAWNICNVLTSHGTDEKVVKEITQAVFPFKYMTAWTISTKRSLCMFRYKEVSCALLMMVWLPNRNIFELLCWSRSSPFMEPEGSLSYSQEPDTGPYPESDE